MGNVDDERIGDMRLRFTPRGAIYHSIGEIQLSSHIAQLGSGELVIVVELLLYNYVSCINRVMCQDDETHEVCTGT